MGHGVPENLADRVPGMFVAVFLARGVPKTDPPRSPAGFDFCANESSVSDAMNRKGCDQSPLM
jgi:hypothetical protein